MGSCFIRIRSKRMEKMRSDLEHDVGRAIKLEREAYDLYMELLGKSKTRNTQDLFSEFAKQELKHESLLKAFLQFEDFEKAKKRIKAEFEGFCAIGDRIDPSEDTRSVLEGFELAIDQERKAQRLYKELLEDADDDQVIELFKALLKEEVEHELLLKGEHDKLFG